MKCTRWRGFKHDDLINYVREFHENLKSPSYFDVSGRTHLLFSFSLQCEKAFITSVCENNALLTCFSFI